MPFINNLQSIKIDDTGNKPHIRLSLSWESYCFITNKILAVSVNDYNKYFSVVQIIYKWFFRMKK